METRDRIHLRDYIIPTDIGAFQSERGNPQRLRFNITVELRELAASRDDLVDSVLSYDVLTQAISVALADQRYNLVETLAEKIAAEILAHPRAACVDVTVEKLDRIPGALGVSIHRTMGRVDVGQESLPVTVLFWQATVPLPAGAVIIVPDAPGLALPEGGNQLRISLLALDQAAWALSGKLGLEVAESRTEMEHAIRAGRAVVWAPSRLAADIGDADPFHLAGWLAGRLGADSVLMALPDQNPLPSPPPDFPVPLVRADGSGSRG